MFGLPLPQAIMICIAVILLIIIVISCLVSERPKKHYGHYVSGDSPAPSEKAQRRIKNLAFVTISLIVASFFYDVLIKFFEN